MFIRGSRLIISECWCIQIVKFRKFTSGLRMCRNSQVSILDLKIECQVTIPEDSD
ncbi:hypothetical protein HanRHA438_Chr03g0115241 [Helianthus annuus]|nr:hypothetical protein HanRHA438_Chr03g0115241 [Helianthus annuus]